MHSCSAVRSRLNPERQCDLHVAVVHNRNGTNTHQARTAEQLNCCSSMHHLHSPQTGSARRLQAGPESAFTPPLTTQAASKPSHQRHSSSSCVHRHALSHMSGAAPQEHMTPNRRQSCGGIMRVLQPSTDAHCWLAVADSAQQPILHAACWQLQQETCSKVPFT